MNDTCFELRPATLTLFSLR